MMRYEKAQRGWTKYGALGIVLSAGIGALSFDALMRLIPNGVSIAIPWALIPLFGLPLTYCIQLLLKVWDFKEQDGLSRSEKRRLELIIDEKTRQLYIAIIYYVLSAVIVAALFIFLSSDPDLFKVVIIITGGLLGISVCSIGLIFLEMKELIDFKAKIKQRSIDRKKQRAALKRLNGS